MNPSSTQRTGRRAAARGGRNPRGSSMADADGKLIGVIGDEDTVTGFLLAGVGHRTTEGANFLVVKPDTPISVVEEMFNSLTSRDDIGIILINQHIANDIRHLLKSYSKTIPTVLEIPSKDHPYDPEHDYIMQRVNMMTGGQG